MIKISYNDLYGSPPPQQSDLENFLNLDPITSKTSFFYKFNLHKEVWITHLIIYDVMLMLIMF